ncbi:MAG TPA: 30S ribosomal protein S16 [Patescibacteria group bacterium]|nr:30S ribosomal protein S16 [Patescibacteria group bacterium]
MLTIRMARVGKTNKAQFKIMLQESTVAPGGRHVEVLGSYDPHRKVATLSEERIKYWLEHGAQASDTVHNLLVSKGVISDKKRAVKLPKKEVEEAKAEEPKIEAAISESPKTEEVKIEEKVEEVKEETKAE